MNRYKRAERALKMCFGKKVYRSYKTAQNDAQKLEKKYKKKYRVYYCPICNWWHLTTKEEK